MEEDREVLLASADELELQNATPTSNGATATNGVANGGHSAANGNGAPAAEANQEDLQLPSARPEPPLEPAAIVYVAACVAAVGGVLFGYDIGVISGAKTQMQKELGLTCSQIGSLVAFLPLGGFFASLLGGLSVDKYGRRSTIIANAFLFTFGALLISSTSSFFVLLVGRFLLGFAVSLSAIAECIYISEIASPEKRGMLVSLNELGITVGILVAFLVNYIFAETPGGWRYMFGLSSFVGVAQGVAMFFLPRTPQFLMIAKREKEAEETLKRLQLTNNVRQTMTNIRLALSEESSQSFVSILLNNVDNIGSRLTIGCGLVLFQQFSGQPNIIYYAADVFRQVGFCSEWSSTLATVGLGFMKVLSTVISLNLVDRIGRRKALVAGVSVMMASVFVLSTFAFYQDGIVGSDGPPVVTVETCSDYSNATHAGQDASSSSCPVSNVPQGMRFVAFAALITFVCAYSFSFGPITWVILSEIFPASTKGRAMALATSLNWLGNSLVSATFLQATATFTLGGVFLSYTLICALAIAFISLLVPETKNKSLEQISKELKSKTTRKLASDHSSCFKRRRRLEMYDNYSPLHQFSI